MAFILPGQCAQGAESESLTASESLRNSLEVQFLRPHADLLNPKWRGFMPDDSDTP